MKLRYATMRDDLDLELDPAEQRVLGCLLEKERTTPDTYPLSLNALQTACNQSTNRDPAVHYDEHVIETALTGLRDRELARRGIYAGSRVTKHKHTVGETLDLNRAQAAVLGVLLLRGPQTVGELKTRCDRLYAFESIDSVEATIDALIAKPIPLAVRLARQPGQKEARIVHTLGGGGGDEEPSGLSRADRLAALEAEVAALRAELGDLKDQLGAQ
jgi:uncharacterized protein YceH (UPF0502 family)